MIVIRDRYLPSAWSASGFLTLGAVDVWSWMVVCCGGCTEHCPMSQRPWPLPTICQEPPCLVTTTDVPRHCQRSSDAFCPQVGNHYCSHTLNNDILVCDGPHIWPWSHEIIRGLKIPLEKHSSCVCGDAHVNKPMCCQLYKSIAHVIMYST